MPKIVKSSATFPGDVDVRAHSLRSPLLLVAEKKNLHFLKDFLFNNTQGKPIVAHPS
jgi:hypothetical protein